MANQFPQSLAMLLAFWINGFLHGKLSVSNIVNVHVTNILLILTNQPLTRHLPRAILPLGHEPPASRCILLRHILLGRVRSLQHRLRYKSLPVGQRVLVFPPSRRARCLFCGFAKLADSTEGDYLSVDCKRF